MGFGRDCFVMCVLCVLRLELVYYMEIRGGSTWLTFT